MSIIADLLVFAEAGAVVEPSSGWYSNGWQYRHRPERQYWNSRAKRNDEKLNFLQRQTDALRTAPPQTHLNDLCAGYLTYNWWNPNGMPNVLSLGGEVRDSCLGASAVTQRPFLWILYADSTIYNMSGCWDYTQSPTLAASESEPDYPATPAEVCAVCADTQYLYVAWYATSGSCQVSAFNAGSMAEVWTADTGIDVEADAVQIIHADSTRLAVLLCGASLSDPTTHVAIVNKSTGAISVGTGSWADNYGDDYRPQNAKIVSDGTRVYWIAHQDNAPTDFTFYLHTALISDPTSAGGHTSRVLGTHDPNDWFDFPTGILRLGSSIVISRGSGLVSVVTPGVSPSMVDLFLPPDFLPESPMGFSHDCDLAFDGLNIWQRLLRQDPGGLADTVFHQIPALEALRIAYHSPTPERTFPAHHMEVDTSVTTVKTGRMHHDGFDLWFIRRGGYAHRITNTAGR